MDFFAQLSQYIGGQSLSRSHILNVDTVFNDGIEKFGGNGDLSLQKSEKWVVHECFCSFKFFDLFG